MTNRRYLLIPVERESEHAACCQCRDRVAYPIPALVLDEGWQTPRFTVIASANARAAASDPLKTEASSPFARSIATRVTETTKS